MKDHWRYAREYLAKAILDKAMEDTDLHAQLLKRAAFRLVDETFAKESQKRAVVSKAWERVTEDTPEDKAREIVHSALGAFVPALEKRAKGMGAIPKALRQIAKLAKDKAITVEQWEQMAKALGYEVAKDGGHLVVVKDGLEIGRFKF